MKKVLIIYKFLPQYRVEFFDKLKDSLLQYDIDLILIYGKLKNQDSIKNDERNLDWAIYRESKLIKVGSTGLLWQPCLDMLPKVDLVIVEQANSLLVNYLLIPLSKVMKFKFAFWGHGANLQDDTNSAKNRFRYFFLNQSDYWFAYTNGVKNFLIEKGVNNRKITVVDNAIDTLSLKQQYDNLSMSEVDNLKTEMGINGNNVAIYCGGIYKEKRVDFLIEASVIIKEKIEDFHLIFVGAGPEAYRVKEASETYDWIHYVGPKFGVERVPYFKMSELFLMPGLVGLAILDTFATETPMITTDFPYHSPEIEYLENGKNGVITANNIDDYSKQVIDLFLNEDKIVRLKESCLNSSTLYSTENMVVNFTNGILKCLQN
jgi:L-malate glycosyltransferase